MIGTTIGRYRIVSRIGGGGMGTVWRAEDPLLHRPVALKLLAPDLAESAAVRRRFVREARAAALLDHPSIPAVFEAGEEGGVAFIAFALLEGETVADRLRRERIPAPEAVRIAVAVADALAHAHGRGVVHRDVTSNNVMLGADGRVWVVDFGLALAIGATRLTSAESVIGTLAYLAPEVFQGSTSDPRSDLYSLGVVLYEMLAGRLPFDARRREALMYAVLHEDAPPLADRPGVDRDLEVLIARLLAKRPADRFQSATELGEALRGSVRSETSSSPSARDEDAPRFRSHREVLAVLPFELVGIGAGSDEALVAQGLAATLGASLGLLPGIEIVPPASLAGSDPHEAARKSGATLALSGTLRRSSHQLRVTYSVVDLRSGRQRGAGTLDGSWTDLFALEDRLVASVRESLDLEEGPPRVRDRIPDPAAHERYVKALGYLQRTDNEAAVDGAIRLLEELADSRADSAVIRAALGRAYLGKHDLTSELRWEHQAASACHRALELDPGSPEVLITLATIHRNSGRLDEAVRLYERVLERGEDFQALHGLSLTLERLGRFPEAAEAARRAIALRPDAWQGYDRLGAISFRAGRYALAVEPWRRVIEITPDNVRGHFRLAAAFFHLDRFDAAIESYERSIAIQPTAEAWTGLGTVLYYSHRFPEAVGAFEKAVGLKPGEPIQWGNLAAACARIPGAETRRRESLDRALALALDRLALDPARASDWAWVACWRAESGRTTEAREAANRALQLAAGDVNVLAQAGIAFELLGDRREALRRIGEAIRSGYGVMRLLRDPELTALCEDPEFQRIVAEHREPPAIDA